MSIQVCLISCMNFDYKEMMEKKLLLEIQSINGVYPSEDNMIVVAIIKRIKIVMSIYVSLILWINFHYEENGKKKDFSCKSKASISCIPMWRTLLSCHEQKEWILLSISKFVSFRGCNFNYKENGGTKALLANPKHQYRIS